MAGMLNDVLARQRVQQLLREGEQERRGARPRDASAQRARRAQCARHARRMLHRLVVRRTARRDSSGDRALPTTIDRFVLDDGRSVRFRHLRHSDRAMYRDAVASLSPRSRYLRFAAPIRRISESLLNQMMDFDGDRHVVYAALTPDERAVVGVARFIRSPDDRHSAEVAIAIADDWQGAGLGSALLAKVIEHARATDVSRLIATTLSENRVAAGLASASGFSITGRAGIYDEYELPLRALARRDVTAAPAAPSASAQRHRRSSIACPG